ncbi:plexin-B3 isoform X2 [Ictalurus punctatus]|uniref:Plexin-B3 isoform X2 n=1 Tax=Ictalurus punctatus TaxID=7998 RepID=A0A2D0QZP3_ICTPU|nr:plexin-B3 isoform X2 [Ictalurus punctatus]
MPAAGPLLLLHTICWWPLVLFLLLPPLPLFARTNPPTFISLHDSCLNHLDTLKTRAYHQTYISRLCAGDPSFYSYVEVPLSCTGGYNLAQAVAMGTFLGKSTMFVAMAAGQASTPAPTGRSALCMYSMEKLDQALERAQFLCYTQEGKGDKEQEAYIAYEVSSKCLKLLQVPPVTRLPVAQCERHSDCHSCLSVRDPYCGWCSLEGRCTWKLECARHSQPHHWLWSYGRDRQCVSIQSLDPAIQSREEQTQEIPEGS